MSDFKLLYKLMDIKVSPEHNHSTLTCKIAVCIDFNL